MKNQALEFINAMRQEFGDFEFKVKTSNGVELVSKGWKSCFHLHEIIPCLQEKFDKKVNSKHNNHK